jgi:hypothetical protein
VMDEDDALNECCITESKHVSAIVAAAGELKRKLASSSSVAAASVSQQQQQQQQQQPTYENVPRASSNHQSNTSPTTTRTGGAGPRAAPPPPPARATALRAAEVLYENVPSQRGTEQSVAGGSHGGEQDVLVAKRTTALVSGTPIDAEEPVGTVRGAVSFALTCPCLMHAGCSGCSLVIS